MAKNPIWLKTARMEVNKILALEPKYHAMGDKQLKHKTVEFRNRLSRGATMDKILPEAYATVREVARRVVGMEHYPVQLLCGIALHQGRIAEQKTGEGKTLAATLPAYLNALDGKGVHVVTVNDYLARRDAQWMGKVYDFLGLTVGNVVSGMSTEARKEAYQCDITYVTNSELGFDYLRDNMALDKERVVLRGLNYAIVDEVDSILIDEARVPLIISGGEIDASKFYTACNAVVKKLERGKASKELNRLDALVGELPEETGDFIVYEKEKAITLTAQGIRKIEKAFGLESFASPENTLLRHAVNQSLYANYLMKRDKDYIVKGGKVQIVDTFTGRVLDGHTYSDGLQQAVEAKERVPIRPEARTVATVTYQLFFRKYRKLCGMTGTAYTVRRELEETYGLKTVVIPTNKKLIRKDLPSVMYQTKDAKYRSVVDEVIRCSEKGQPVLVGTASVKDSEELDYLLSIADIPHQVLNAKQDEQEAEIIAKAGIHGTVTVATNMAGRGTDIILDEEARKAGGLKVIGTELHESVRIDDQLRGRSGRQGDPGESVFYVSAQDRLIRLYAGESLEKMLKKEEMGEDSPLPKRPAAHYAKHAQQVIEENLYGERKAVLAYDIVNDRQRELIYEERKRILAGRNITALFDCCIRQYIRILEERCDTAKKMAEAFRTEIKGIPIRKDISGPVPKGKRARRKQKRELSSLIYTGMRDKADQLDGQKNSRRKAALLQAIDRGWIEQISALECLRQCIGYQGYAQIAPERAYALEAFKLYAKMQDDIYETAVRQFFQEGEEF